MIYQSINEIKEMVNQPIVFDLPVVVKSTPHTTIINIYGVEKTPQGDVYVMVADGSFHQLEATDKNADLVANSILQRLKFLKCNQ